MRIVIDPGHGGSDPGAEGNGLVEKVKALEYALELGKCLQKLGFTVDYTRTTDVYVSLADRAIRANNFGADIFVSWHFNCFNGIAKGIEVFSIGYVGTGAKLAYAVVAEMAAATGAVNRGAKIANFQVLRDTNMPAILIEGGFLDSSDADLIKTEEYKRNCMIGATKGICKVLGIPWTNPYITVQEENTMENAILVYGPDDTVTARRLAESLGNCAVFFRKIDGSASPDVKAAKTLYIVGGGSVGHPNEKILSGDNYFRTVDAVGKALGQ